MLIVNRTKLCTKLHGFLIVRPNFYVFTILQNYWMCRLFAPNIGFNIFEENSTNLEEKKVDLFITTIWRHSWHFLSKTKIEKLFFIEISKKTRATFNFKLKSLTFITYGEWWKFKFVLNIVIVLCIYVKRTKNYWTVKLETVFFYFYFLAYILPQLHVRPFVIYCTVHCSWHYSRTIIITR